MEEWKPASIIPMLAVVKSMPMMKIRIRASDPKWRTHTLSSTRLAAITVVECSAFSMATVENKSLSTVLNDSQSNSEKNFRERLKTCARLSLMFLQR